MSFFLTDSHVHLQDPAFCGDLDDVLRRAKEQGIERFFCNGTSPDDWDDVRRLADEREEIVPFFGLHPWYVDRADDWEERLAHFLDRKPVGIGEIGLDYHIKPRNESQQKEAFRIQLRLAKKRELPVTIHSVHALYEILPILEAEGPFPTVLLHSFSGPVDRIEQLKRLGCYFSFPATVLKPKNRRVREAAVAVPLDRILLESDAPALPPQPGNRNEPTVLEAILNELACLRNIPSRRLRERLFENSQAVYSSIPGTPVKSIGSNPSLSAGDSGFRRKS